MKLFFGIVIGAVCGGVLGVKEFGNDALIPGIIIGAIIGIKASDLVLEISKHI